MDTRTKLVVSTFSGLALLGMSSLSVSARIVCNEDGDCWHVQEEYAFPPGVHIEYTLTIGAGRKGNTSPGRNIPAGGIGATTSGAVSDHENDQSN